MLIETKGEIKTSTGAYVAYKLLLFGFVVLPFLAGLDKFFHLLANWEMYLAPQVMAALSPIGAHNLMMAVGAIEIVAAIIVAVKPRIGAYIVAVWLWAIVINLLIARGFYDIALRDFALSLGALALAQLARTDGANS